MKIIKMLLLEVGQYDDMFMRPFKSNVGANDLNYLQEVTRGGTNLTPTALAGIGADIIRPSATVGSAIKIAEGFQQGRLIFMMEVEWPGTGGMTVVEYLTGYTDRVGVQDTWGKKQYDPHMRLFFNNVIRARRAPTRGGFFNRQSTTAMQSLQVIAGDYRPQLDNLHNVPHLMRPQDVLSNLSMVEARTIMGGDVFDTRPTHGPDLLAVNDRRNTIPGHYLSRLMNTWNTRVDQDHADEATMYSTMSSDVAEPTITKMRTLQALTLNSELREGGSVTWGDLTRLDDIGRLEDRTTPVLAQSHQSRGLLSRAGQFERWDGNIPHTIMAAGLAQAVPGLMSSLLLTMVEFTTTNRTLDGQWLTTITDWQTFNEGDEAENQVQLFVNRLESDLLMGLSANNSIEMELTCSFDVMSQTFIKVWLNGEEIPYMTPSFCDGLYSNVRAPNVDTLDSFSTELQKLMINLHSDRSASHTEYTPIEVGYRKNEANHSL